MSSTSTSILSHGKEWDFKMDECVLHLLDFRYTSHHKPQTLKDISSYGNILSSRNMNLSGFTVDDKENKIQFLFDDIKIVATGSWRVQSGIVTAPRMNHSNDDYILMSHYFNVVLTSGDTLNINWSQGLEVDYKSLMIKDWVKKFLEIPSPEQIATSAKSLHQLYLTLKSE